MKKLLAILFTSLILISSSCLATEEAKKDPAKYKVTLNVTYNTIGIAEANKIVADSLERHKNACKNEVTIKKDALVDYVDASVS